MSEAAKIAYCSAIMGIADALFKFREKRMVTKDQSATLTLRNTLTELYRESKKVLGI